MIDPGAGDIGRPVLYRSFVGGKVEAGIISSFSDAFVFVRYAGRGMSVATQRQDLEWFAKRAGNPDGPHLRIENVARSICAQILNETTMDKSDIPYEIERSWISYVTLIADDALVDAIEGDLAF